MDFQQAVKTCFQKYADFTGRASRAEFWWFVLFTFIATIVAGVIFRGWINQLVSLALFVPSIAVGARRLHDIGKSGWLQLLWIIPVVGWAILIYWGVQPSGPANEHGAPAEGRSGGGSGGSAGGGEPPVLPPAAPPSGAV